MKSLKVGESKYTYSFEATEWPNGHYVHTIAGHKEEPSHYHYWLLYQVPTLPDPASPPGNNLITPVGQCALPPHLSVVYLKLLSALQASVELNEIRR